jgi:hypothetical protein
MKTVIMYEANDGKQFFSEERCLLHEQECSDVDAANKLLKDGHNMFDVLSRCSSYFLECLIEFDKEDLKKITRRTEFVVVHWQCRKTPGYRPIKVDHNCNVYLWGDAGSWSGPCGGWVEWREMLRYLRQGNCLLIGHKN